jgi:Kdo2-lipid IVA lauroyltransferase/acyltransferase
MKGRKQKKGALTQRAEYTLYRFLSFPVRVSSTARMERWSDRVSRMAPRLFARRHRMVLRNLERVFPEWTAEKRDDVARKCWRHFAWVSLRFIRATSEDVTALVDRTQVNGRDHFDRALAQGHGVIVVTAHYGDWEAASAILSDVDAPVTVVARTLDNELLERDLYSARMRANVTMVDRRRAARPLLRTLEAKGAVVVLADQAVQPREGILVPFLGSPAWTTPAPARLAVKTGAPIVIAFCEPRPDGGVAIDVVPAIDPATLSEDEKTPEALMTRVNDILSARIKANPELWLWMHDRWKKAK